MNPTADNDRIIIKYLLNDLSEEDRAQLEEAYLRDESLFDQIQAMEEELIEDYVKGRLSGYERERFEQHYLASREQRARVETVRQLDRACSLTPPDPALAGARIARQPSSVRSWQRAMGRPRSVLMLGAAAFLLILGLGMFAELLRLRGRLAAINREQAALEARIEESDRTLSRFREELAEERQQDLPLREKLKNITTRPDRLKPEKVPPSPSKEQVVSLALAPNMRAPGGIDKAVISADTR
ncbi:MAG TPA: hypothetical protein VJ302_27495, partial [Blastocatellia bacterium]|nr:hypothetical protein [Blastocatellia bacterium]